MARMARAVIPDFPHHVTQRGNRRQRTFFCEDDYRLYIDLLADALEKADAEILAYCLMPNHVHLVVTPRNENSLAKLFQEAHRRYTCTINLRQNWRGHLWQERFHSFVMDEQHLLAAVRYIELNPVRAGLCVQPSDWPWSSVHAHLTRKDDKLVSVEPMLNRVSDWPAYLSVSNDEDTINTIRQHTRSGRPAGGPQFIEQVSRICGRDLAPRRPGRPAKN
ncbi:MAG: REP-associated tyrosine transposase [Gammaproteobacteria bacterium]